MYKETIIIFSLSIIFILSVILSVVIGIITMTFEEMFCLWALFFATGELTYFLISVSQKQPEDKVIFLKNSDLIDVAKKIKDSGNKSEEKNGN